MFYHRPAAVTLSSGRWWLGESVTPGILSMDDDTVPLLVRGLLAALACTAMQSIELRAVVCGSSILPSQNVSSADTLPLSLGPYRVTVAPESHARVPVWVLTQTRALRSSPGASYSQNIPKVASAVTTSSQPRTGR